jgi:hypothetical protein
LVSSRNSGRDNIKREIYIKSLLIIGTNIRIKSIELRKILLDWKNIFMFEKKSEL